MLLVAAVGTQAAVTGVTYVSTPGDYVGQGASRTYTAPSAFFDVQGDTKHVYVGGSQDGHVWSIEFEAPQTLTVGSYPNVARSHAHSPLVGGMSVGIDYHGCGRLAGSFRVLEYEIDAYRVIKKLAIDFVQYCEVTGPPLYGAVRVNSEQPLVVPGVVSVAGMDLGSVAADRHA